MRAEERLLELANRLVQSTESGQIEWKGDQDSGFYVSTAAGAINIQSKDRDGQQPYRLVIYDSAGTEVDSLETYTYQIDVDEWEPAAWNDSLETLYETARRNALNIDKVINDIVRDLGLGPL
jgi:hypothetical protein